MKICNYLHKICAMNVPRAIVEQTNLFIAAFCAVAIQWKHNSKKARGREGGERGSGRWMEKEKEREEMCCTNYSAHRRPEIVYDLKAIHRIAEVNRAQKRNIHKHEKRTFAQWMHDIVCKNTVILNGSATHDHINTWMSAKTVRKLLFFLSSVCSMAM